MVKTIDELRKVSDEELLSYYEEAKGHTKDFKEYFGVEYSYNMIDTVLKEKGYKFGYYKPSDNKGEAENDTFKIAIERQSGNNSMNLTMTNECREKYKEFVAENGDAFVHTTAALTLYMELCNAGRLEVTSVHVSPAKKRKK